jgi:hypothetical protein
MAQKYNPDDLSPEDLQRMLSREYEDRLDWLENQTPQPAPPDPATLPHRGFLAALRDFLARFRRPAADVD